MLPPPRKDTNFVHTSLKTEDIHGCGVGTKGLGNFHTRERKDIRLINKNYDIEGSEVGSLRKSPDTKR